MNIVAEVLSLLSAAEDASDTAILDYAVKVSHKCNEANEGVFETLKKVSSADRRISDQTWALRVHTVHAYGLDKADAQLYPMIVREIICDFERVGRYCVQQFARQAPKLSAKGIGWDRVRRFMDANSQELKDAKSCNAAVKASKDWTPSNMSWTKSDKPTDKPNADKPTVDIETLQASLQAAIERAERAEAALKLMTERAERAEAELAKMTPKVATKRARVTK